MVYSTTVQVSMYELRSIESSLLTLIRHVLYTYEQRQVRVLLVGAIDVHFCSFTTFT